MSKRWLVPENNSPSPRANGRCFNGRLRKPAEFGREHRAWNVSPRVNPRLGELTVAKATLTPNVGSPTDAERRLEPSYCERGLPDRCVTTGNPAARPN